MKKKLLVLNTIIGLAIAGTAFANGNEAGSKKQQDLRSCKAQSEQLSEDVRTKQQETCKCVVENTDYEALVEAKNSGDMAKAQEIKTEAQEACRGEQ